jgi:hypothetical protein
VSLVAYADESGTHDAKGLHQGAEVAVVMGWVAEKDAWDIFDDKWQQVLVDHNIQVFHMSEFVDKKNGPNDPNWPYLGWSDTKRDKFIRKLIALARDHAYFGIGGALNVKDYDAIVPEWTKQEAKHPYTFCFQLFFDMLLPALRENLEEPLPDGEQVAFFFDRQKEFKARAELAFDIIKAMRDAEDRMGALTWADKAKYRPLQAADLLAYIIRSAQARRVRTGSEDILVPGTWEDDLLARRNIIVGYYDKKNLPEVIARMTRHEPD